MFGNGREQNPIQLVSSAAHLPIFNASLENVSYPKYKQTFLVLPDGDSLLEAPLHHATGGFHKPFRFPVFINPCTSSALGGSRFPCHWYQHSARRDTLCKPFHTNNGPTMPAC